MLSFLKRIQQTLTDIVNFRHSQEEFARERNQLRALIDNLPDLIYFKDIKSRFIDANKATILTMKCKSREDLIGKTDFEFYSKEFAEKFFKDEQELLNTGKSRINVEEPIIDENNRAKILSTSKIVLRDDSGKVIGLVGIGRDITERKKAEEILKRDNEILEKIVKERTKELLEIQAEFDQAKRLSDIGTLAAMVAHELRNPMGVIAMSTRCLKKDKNLANNEYLAKIEMKLSEGDQIIDNLLNYSRIKPPSHEPVNLAELLDDCISSSQARFPQHEVLIEKLYDTRINIVEVDPFQMKEVFINIVNNAIQAFAGKTGKMAVITQLKEDWVKIIIQDNGVGIAKEDLDKIFMPFFTRKSKGTGLGLTVCKEIVHLHNGNIDVHSILGEGTIFNIILPIKKSH